MVKDIQFRYLLYYLIDVVLNLFFFCLLVFFVDVCLLLLLGYGKFTNGCELYVGQWFENLIQGTGVYTFASGSTYDGQWFNNKFHGRGTYIWKNGAQYIGDWVENK
jgi:hypothetical protein